MALWGVIGIAASATFTNAYHQQSNMKKNSLSVFSPVTDKIFFFEIVLKNHVLDFQQYLSNI